VNAIAPGYGGPGLLSCSNVSLSSLTHFQVDLNGTTPGAGYDQLNVHGSLDLGDATLSVTLGYTPAIGDSFVIINNDGADAITGMFAGLPQGAFLTNGVSIFRISYRGGDGNDVVLYRVNPPARLTSIARLANSSVQLQGAGLSNLTYTIQASTNLLVWTNIGAALANLTGAFSFNDTNAPLFPLRFYRALSP